MPKNTSKIALDILKVLAVAGIVAVAATSPYFLLNLSKALRKKDDYLSKEYEPNKISKTLLRLKQSKMVVVGKGDYGYSLELSEKGKKKFQKLCLKSLEIKRTKKWDGLWRVVIFDIPEKLKIGRSALRDMIKRLGFYQLQKSVWVLPYDCEKEIQLLSDAFGITEFVNYLEVKRIKDDQKLKENFNF